METKQTERQRAAWNYLWVILKNPISSTIITPRICFSCSPQALTSQTHSACLSRWLISLSFLSSGCLCFSFLFVRSKECVVSDSHLFLCYLLRHPVGFAPTCQFSSRPTLCVHFMLALASEEWVWNWDFNPHPPAVRDPHTLSPVFQVQTVNQISFSLNNCRFIRTDEK